MSAPFSSVGRIEHLDQPAELPSDIGRTRPPDQPSLRYTIDSTRFQNFRGFEPGTPIDDRQFAAAQAAAPYVHARLSSTTVKGDDPFAGMTRADIDRLIASYTAAVADDVDQPADGDQESIRVLHS